MCIDGQMYELYCRRARRVHHTSLIKALREIEVIQSMGIARPVKSILETATYRTLRDRNSRFRYRLLRLLLLSEDFRVLTTLL